MLWSLIDECLPCSGSNGHYEIAYTHKDEYGPNWADIGEALRLYDNGAKFLGGPTGAYFSFSTAVHNFSFGNGCVANQPCGGYDVMEISVPGREDSTVVRLQYSWGLLEGGRWYYLTENNSTDSLVDNISENVSDFCSAFINRFLSEI